MLKIALLYNANLHRLACKLFLLQEVKEKENDHFFSSHFHMVFEEQIALSS